MKRFDNPIVAVVRLPRDFRDQLEEIAQERRESMAAVIRRWIDEEHRRMVRRRKKQAAE